MTGYQLFYRGLQVVYDVVLIGVAIYAVRCGGRDERLGAAIMIVGSVATLLVVTVLPFDWRSNKANLVLVDLAVLAAFLVLALRSRRYWPLWATAPQVIGVSMHFLQPLLPPEMVKPYSLLQGFWGYLMLAAIALGTMRTRRPPAARRAP